MVIGVVTADPLPSLGGVQNVVWHLSRVLATRGHCTVALCPGPPGPGVWGPLAIERTQFRSFSLRAWLRDPSLLERQVNKCRHFLRARGAEVAHVHSVGAEAFYAALAARSISIGTVASVHGFRNAGTLTRMGIWMERLTYMRCGVITACCEADRAGILARHPSLAERVRTVPNGVDLTEVDSLAQPGVVGRILFVGRLTEQKGADVLLRAWAAVEAVGRHYELLIAGTGPQEAALRSLAEQLSLKNVTWLGQLTPDETVRAVHGAEIVCLPSRWEGMPLVALEAMAARRPVVASDVGGLREVVVHGESGFLVPRENPAALSHALQCLLHEPKRAVALGNAGRRRCERHFNWERLVDCYIRAYEDAQRVGSS